MHETPDPANPSEPPPFPSPRPTTRLPAFAERTFALEEQLDGPCTYETYRKAMLDMAQANRLTHGYQPLLRLLSTTISRRGVGHAPLHLLDLGCGHGDFLRIAHRWAKHRSIPLRLTGIDMHPYAVRLAKQLDREQHLSPGTIHWGTGDALTDSTGADLIVCSLVAHHLPDDEVIRLLQRCAQARAGWTVIDLRRSRRAAQMFDLFARILRWHPMVRYDGAVSFRRAFSLHEWQTLVARAALQAEVIDAGWGRIVVRNL